MNQLQRPNGKVRRKTVNKRRQQQQQQTDSSPSNISSSNRLSGEDESIDEVNEAETTIENGEQNDYQSSTPIREDSTVPSKPQASVAPVKQMHSPNFHSRPFKSHSDFYSRQNGHSSSGYHHSYSNHQNSLPPRFRQQLEQREAEMNNHYQQTFRRRRGRSSNFRTFYPHDQRNDYRSSSPPPPPRHHHHHQQQQQQQQQEEEGGEGEEEEEYYEDEQQTPLPPDSMNNHHQSPPCSPPPPHQHHHQDYSSESELLSDAPSTNPTTSASPSISTSVGSQSPLRGLELLRTLSNSNGLFNDLVALFDNVSFSTSELELLISKIATKHILNKQEVTRLLSSTKTDPSIEQILDDTYLSQVKILAIELQAEKTRVSELTRLNANLDQTVRQFQQQQGQPNLVQYQQAFVSYQMQLKQLVDENVRLRHQLHAYSMMPTTLNELKQQHQHLSEQLRQLTVRNSALENEAAESERASKHAAEIYKKADSQKQEKIEQMIADINKYKKLDKELTVLKQKHVELEKDCNNKINEITAERDDLKKQCENLAEQVKSDDVVQKKYDQIIHHPSLIAKRQLEQELNEFKAKNDQLRQENWKTIEKINGLSTNKK